MGLASNVVSELSARWHQFFFKEPKIFPHCFRFGYLNDVCRKKNHQVLRFMIESAKVFPQKVMKVPRGLRKMRQSDKAIAVKR